MEYESLVQAFEYGKVVERDTLHTQRIVVVNVSSGEQVYQMHGNASFSVKKVLEWLETPADRHLAWTE